MQLLHSQLSSQLLISSPAQLWQLRDLYNSTILLESRQCPEVTSAEPYHYFEFYYGYIARRDHPIFITDSITARKHVKINQLSQCPQNRPEHTIISHQSTEEIDAITQTSETKQK